MKSKPSIDDVIAFHRAAMSRDVAKVKRMLDAGMPPDVLSPHGFDVGTNSAMMHAIQDDHANLACVLLDAGAHPSNVPAGATIRTTSNLISVGGMNSLLLVACTFTQTAVASVLLDRDQNFRLLSDERESAAHLLLRNSPPSLSAGMLEKIKSLISDMVGRGLPINQVDSGGNTLLHAAIDARYPPSMLRLLLELGADPRIENKEEMQLAHQAAQLGRPDVLQLLADTGVDIDSTNAAGQTPLFYFNTQTVLDKLLEQGANLDHQDVQGRTAVLLSIQDKCTAREASGTTAMLITAGASLDVADYKGRLPVDVAKRRKLKPTQQIISAGLARNAMLRQGRSATASHSAALE